MPRLCKLTNKKPDKKDMFSVGVSPTLFQSLCQTAESFLRCDSKLRCNRKTSAVRVASVISRPGQHAMRFRRKIWTSTADELEN